jgi:hypothetical protein
MARLRGRFPEALQRPGSRLLRRRPVHHLGITNCTRPAGAAREQETPMAKPKPKIDLPVAQIRRYLEPGPVVIVSSALGDARNIMTMGWHTIMEFTPSIIGCVIAAGNCS